MLDFFLDDVVDGMQPLPVPSSSEKAPPPPSSSSSAAGPVDPELAKTVARIQGLVNDDLVKSINGVYVFEIQGLPFNCYYFESFCFCGCYHLFSSVILCFSA